MNFCGTLDNEFMRLVKIDIYSDLSEFLAWGVILSIKNIFFFRFQKKSKFLMEKYRAVLATGWGRRKIEPKIVLDYSSPNIAKETRDLAIVDG